MRSLAELQSLEGRMAVVTGGAGHVGLACLEVLAELGVGGVLVVDREANASAERAALLAAKGVRALSLAVDLEDASTPGIIVDRCVKELGGIDILVNNAAYTGATVTNGWAVPFASQTADAWDAAMRVNLRAPFLLAQSAHAHLAKNRGVIVNVGSIYGSVGPDMGLYEGTAMQNPAAYGASKGGLLQLTRHLATVMAPDVRVNVLSPGGIERGQPAAFRDRYCARTPLRRMAREEDLKGAFAFLVSDASGYVTGQCLHVDGGWTAW